MTRAPMQALCCEIAKYLDTVSKELPRVLDSVHNSLGDPARMTNGIGADLSVFRCAQRRLQDTKFRAMEARQSMPAPDETSPGIRTDFNLWTLTKCSTIYGQSWG